jgi:diguanylate cyclase (GGDEF)-like protein
MRSFLGRANPLHSLRLRLCLVVFGAIGALALFMSAQFSSRLTAAYREAGRAQLTGIADAWSNRFTGRGLKMPKRLQDRIHELRMNNETLHKISISWHDEKGETMLVQSGHEHDPDGTKRDVSTAKVLRSTPGSQPAPIDAGEYRYHEVHATDGAHYAELNTRLVAKGHEPAALELHYDLAGLDAALARDKRTVAVAAALAALTLALLVNFLIGRTLLAPLDKLRRATQRIGQGETTARLNWGRKDEIGTLAADFDRMAHELHSVHSHLEALALKDPLSGLLNHRAFQERLAQELRRAEREGYSVAVVAIDVDHFKEINDRWGHAAGDEALRQLGKALQGELRPSDICGRVGGDEFMLAIVRSDVDHARSVVERLRETVATSKFGPAGDSLTISAGISEFPRHSLALEELTHLADGAMYWAKSSGRNRSYVYSSESDFAKAAVMTAEQVMEAGLVNTVHALAKAVDAKDGYTHSHSQRVACYAAALARALCLDAYGVEQVRTAGVLHDVGKIGISDVLLLKPSSLTPEEMQTMRRHSELGRDIVAGAGMSEIARFVYHLHERIDGTGYPDGLEGDQIPLESRILHVADALEAMTSSRVYREALSIEEALEEIRRGSGTQFDSTVTEKLMEVVEAGEIGVADDLVEDTELLEVAMVSGGTAPSMNGTNGSNGSNGRPHPEGVADAGISQH